MSLVIKTIKGKRYYYSFLSYFLIRKSKSFSKYIGTQKPSPKELIKTENAFRDELIMRESGKAYINSFISKDEVIKSLLISRLFKEKYRSLSESMRRRYDIDSTVRFTLTTLTTEDVDVDLADVENALSKSSRFTQREQISRNMLNAVELIKQRNDLSLNFLLKLHRMIMATFETKSPGSIRKRQVYLYRKNEFSTARGIEVTYRPPDYKKIGSLLSKFFEWYKESELNPLEKAAIAHYELYKIHPFLDGNKRICRLIYNKTLVDNGFPLINISVNKDLYFDKLVMAVENNDPKPFVNFTINQYYLQMREFLDKNK